MPKAKSPKTRKGKSHHDSPVHKKTMISEEGRKGAEPHALPAVPARPQRIGSEFYAAKKTTRGKKKQEELPKIPKQSTYIPSKPQFPVTNESLPSPPIAEPSVPRSGLLTSEAPREPREGVDWVSQWAGLVLTLKLLAAGAMLVVLYVVASRITSGMSEKKVLTAPPDTTAAIDTFNECAAAGNYVNDGEPRICQTPDGLILLQDLPSDGELASVDPILYISSPVKGERIDRPLVLHGRSRVYDNPVVVRIADIDGTELASAELRTTAPAHGNYGTLSTVLPYPSAKGTEGIVEVYEKAPGGQKVHDVRIPVKF